MERELIYEVESESLPDGSCRKVLRAGILLEKYLAIKEGKFETEVKIILSDILSNAFGWDSIEVLLDFEELGVLQDGRYWVQFSDYCLVQDYFVGDRGFVQLPLHAWAS
jgi:hypothetical protein